MVGEIFEMKIKSFFRKVKIFFRKKFKGNQASSYEMQKNIDASRNDIISKRETDGDGGWTPP